MINKYARSYLFNATVIDPKLIIDFKIPAAQKPKRSMRGLFEIKPSKCPRCRREPSIWPYQELLTERPRCAIQHRCNTGSEWIEIYAHTVFGAILHWDWHCVWERLKSPANCPTCGTPANVRDHRYYGRMVVVTSNCRCSLCAQGETPFWAVLIWNIKCWLKRCTLKRKCGNCRWSKDRSDGLSVLCRCIISPKHGLAMHAEKQRCWAWAENRRKAK